MLGLIHEKNATAIIDSISQNPLSVVLLVLFAAILQRCHMTYVMGLKTVGGDAAIAVFFFFSPLKGIFKSFALSVMIIQCERMHSLPVFPSPCF